MTNAPTKPEQHVIWQPMPNYNGKPSSQALAMSCPCNHILYDGSRGPGKTDAQLMYFRRFVGQGYGHFWTGIIFDRQFSMLDDLIKKSRRWFPRFKDGARFTKGGSLRWEWPTGESLLFRYMRDPKDYENYHGQEYTFIGWNELTKHPTSELYDLMMSCNRSSFVPELHSPDLDNPLPPIPLTVFSTTNPHGPGHVWVKERFVDVNNGKPGTVHRITANVFNPQTQKEETITKTQTRIFGSYKENRFLSPEYVLELDNIKDENKRKAWLQGDWEIDAGGAFEGVWDKSVHVLQRFKIPKEWRVERSLDWGSTHPFSVGFWARSNGEEVKLPNGKTLHSIPGDLFRIHEWYGSMKIGTNKGIKLSARNLAKGIVEIERELRDQEWIKSSVRPGPADGQIYSVNEEESDSIASKMAEEGITWIKADKRPGSRKTGLQLMRDAFENSLGDKDEDGIVTRSRPGLFVFEHCEAFIKTIPFLPRDEDEPDDVDTTAEDHAYDDARYEVVHALKDYVTELEFSLLT
jgi:hypothetical protein